MSFKMTEVCKFLPVSPTQKLVLLILADCHNEQTGRCDPSYAYLMKITGLSNRAIANALKALRQAGHIQFSSQNGSRSSYILTPQTSEPNDTKPVNEVHRFNGSTSERESQPPVNLVPEPVNVIPKAVNEVHIKRKEPEETGKESETKSRRSWAQDVRRDADEASAVPLPESWPPAIRTAMTEFFSFRHEMATKPTVKSAVKPWTVRAASSTISQVSTAIEAHGPDPVLSRIQSALSAGWQGLHLDGIQSGGRFHSSQNGLPFNGDTPYRPTMKL